MPKIHFINENQTLEMKSGGQLWYAAHHGIKFTKDPNCQGKGKCGKCTVHINGVRALSCETRIGEEDAEIETMIFYKENPDA